MVAVASFFVIALVFGMISVDHTDACEPKCGKPGGVSWIRDFIDTAYHRVTGKKREHKIVGGSMTQPNEWPWLVNIRKKNWYGGFSLCGGSLIRVSDYVDKSDIVITAEHCVCRDYEKPCRMYESVQNFKVTAGDWDRTTYENTEQIASVKSIHSPGGYPYKDIAIIVLDKPIFFNDEVGPVCLPRDNANDPAPGTRCIVTGWGTLNSGGQAQNKSQEVSVPITTDACCDALGSGNVAKTPADICAGEPGKDSCQGDSGGPLHCQLGSSGFWFLTGVVSRGIGCAEKNNPGVYARVTFNLEWIKKQMCLSTFA